MGIGEAKAAVAKAYAAGKQPQLLSVAPSGRDEIWILDGVAFVLPVVPSDAPPELEYALRLRRDASLSGQCDDCKASFGIVPGSQSEKTHIMEAVIPHRRNCPARDENIGPYYREYYRAQDSKSWSDNFSAASKQTKEKIESQLSDAIVITQTPDREAWAMQVLDKELEQGKRCGHLSTRPAQTWNLLLDEGKFRCDECWAYFEEEVVSGKFRMPILDDHTCDKCRKYSSNLHPLVLRLSNFVLRGGLCRRCAQEFELPRQRKEVGGS